MVAEWADARGIAFDVHVPVLGLCERFTLPPGAEQLAESGAGVQAFRLGRHLAAFRLFDAFRQGART